MKLQYLGTAAAEGIPAMFCDCEVCKQARKAGGKNLRTRSQAIVDGTLLIDFPADTYIHSVKYNIELSKIHTCIITHNHLDHLYPSDIEMRKHHYAHTKEPAIVFYGTYPAYGDITNTIIKSRMMGDGEAEAVLIKAFEPFEADGYKITPLKADHGPQTEPVIYIIEKDSKKLLYAHDTGIFPDETWEYLEKNPVRFDLVSFDCTEPMTGLRKGHMSLDSNNEVRERMRKMGLVDDKTKFVINHFSHNGKINHDELVPIAEKEGYMVSYDGMTVEF